MKLFKISMIVTLSLFCITPILSQEKIYKERVSTKILVGEPSEKIKKENFDLQSLVESIYVNSSKFYNQALPNIEKGEFLVLIIDNDLDVKKHDHIKQTKMLKGISLNQIEKLTYEKSQSLYESALFYGNFGRSFGMVTLKLKKPKNTEENEPFEKFN